MFSSLPALQRDLSGPVSQFTRNSIAMTEMAENSSAVGSVGSGVASPKVLKHSFFPFDRHHYCERKSFGKTWRKLEGLTFQWMTSFFNATCFTH